MKSCLPIFVALIVILLAIGVFYFVVRVPMYDYESNYTVADSADAYNVPTIAPFSEGYVFLASQEEFFSAMHKVGLEWTIFDLPTEGGENFRPHAIINPQRNTVATFNFRSGFGAVFGRENITIYFTSQRRAPRTGELNVLQQENTLTLAEWAQFWELLGILLDEVCAVADIAERATEYFSNITSVSNEGAIIWKGYDGYIDYRVEFRMSYGYHTLNVLSLTEGISETWREMRP